MDLRDVFELTGRAFDLAEAHWELLHAEGDVVEMHRSAWKALACSFYNMLRWADLPGRLDAFYAMAPRGVVIAVPRRSAGADSTQGSADIGIRFPRAAD
jgi:hypothetical protein